MHRAVKLISDLRNHFVNGGDETVCLVELGVTDTVFFFSTMQILTAVLTYPVLRTFSLWLHSSLTGNYVSGSYSIVFVNCPNEQIARDLARYSACRA